uniref:Uncharacterized protein n=1 Tax=Glossina palpalis gambiensis TaxID=67801 RepID=A0A1B0ARX5_9MUSC
INALKLRWKVLLTTDKLLKIYAIWIFRNTIVNVSFAVIGFFFSIQSLPPLYNVGVVYSFLLAFAFNDFSNVCNRLGRHSPTKFGLITFCLVRF